MKHYFGVIIDEKIIDILNKVYNNQKINIILNFTLPDFINKTVKRTVATG